MTHLFIGATLAWTSSFSPPCSSIQNVYQTGGCCDSGVSASLTPLHDDVRGRCTDTRQTYDFAKSRCVSAYNSMPCEAHPSYDLFTALGMYTGNTQSVSRYNATIGACVATGTTEATRIIPMYFAIPSTIQQDTASYGGVTIPPTVLYPDQSRYVMGNAYTHYTGAWNKGVYEDELTYEYMRLSRAAYAFLGMFDSAELAHYPLDGYATGAENGVVQLLAMRAAAVARRTCTRHFYVYQSVVHGPHYGFDFNIGVAGFYATAALAYMGGTEATGCTGTQVTMEWTTDPSRASVPPTSIADDSPWLEVLILPNNPDGRCDTPTVPSDRAILDGIYLFPSFFPNGVVDPACKPDGFGWAFSTHKWGVPGTRTGHVMLRAGYESERTMVQDIALDIGVSLPSDAAMRAQMEFLRFVLSASSRDAEGSFVRASVATISHKFALIAEAFAPCVSKGILSYVGTPGRGVSNLIRINPPYRAEGRGLFLQSFGVFSKNVGDDMMRVNIEAPIVDLLELKRRAHHVCADPAVNPLGLTPLMHFAT